MKPPAFPRASMKPTAANHATARRVRREADCMNADALTFTFPGPPPHRTAQCSRRAVFRGGKLRVYIDRKAREAEAALADAFRVQLPPGWTPRRDPCEVVADFTFPPRRKDRKTAPDAPPRPHAQRPDAENVWKPVGDAMQRAGVIADDGTIYSLTVHKWRGPVPSLSVRVRWPFPPPPVAVQGTLFPDA